jgi:hypothetical protein
MRIGFSDPSSGFQIELIAHDRMFVYNLLSKSICGRKFGDGQWTWSAGSERKGQKTFYSRLYLEKEIVFWGRGVNEDLAMHLVCFSHFKIEFITHDLVFSHNSPPNASFLVYVDPPNFCSQLDPEFFFSPSHSYKARKRFRFDLMYMENWRRSSIAIAIFRDRDPQSQAVSLYNSQKGCSLFPWMRLVPCLVLSKIDHDQTWTIVDHALIRWLADSRGVHFILGSARNHAKTTPWSQSDPANPMQLDARWIGGALTTEYPLP